MIGSITIVVPGAEHVVDLQRRADAVRANRHVVALSDDLAGRVHDEARVRLAEQVDVGVPHDRPLRVDRCVTVGVADVKQPAAPVSPEVVPDYRQGLDEEVRSPDDRAVVGLDA